MHGEYGLSFQGAGLGVLGLDFWGSEAFLSAFGYLGKWVFVSVGGEDVWVLPPARCPV